MRGLLFVDQFHQGVGKTKLRIGILALGSQSGAAYQGIIGPENQGKSIEEKYTFIHASKVGISSQSTVDRPQSTEEIPQQLATFFGGVKLVSVFDFRVNKKTPAFRPGQSIINVNAAKLS